VVILNITLFKENVKKMREMVT